ncbi:lipopolysaccharide biosynthesis protein [Thermoleophilia bacterium SCSIO 60948]|nr:lipopolysaccharide biosynthesis protein [Thermoleophilia bacterium SCSIO 60948]
MAATSDGETGTETRRFARSAGGLSVGIGLAGLTTYVYFSLAAHNLSAEDYGQVVVLWSAVFVLISVLHRPVEQLLSRSISEREAHGASPRRAILAAARIEAVVAIGWLAAALAFREPLTDDLLDGNETLYWILVVAVLAFAASFFARGYMAGRRRFGAVAAIIICESLGRAAFALLVALGIASGQTVVALGIVAAPFISLVVVPIALVRGGPAPAPIDDPTEERSGSGTGFAAAVLCVMAAEQTLLNAGPLLVSSIEGAALAGFVFNVLMVARAPLVVFQGVSTSILPHLTRLHAQGGADSETEFDRAVRTVLVAISGFTVAVIAGLLLVGPAVMQLAFSDEFTYGRGELCLVAAGMGLYLASTTLSQAALAGGLARAAAACWLGAAVAFLAWCVAGPLEPALRVETGFLGAALALFAALAVLYPRARSGAGRLSERDERTAQLRLSEDAGL